ncbi:MAG: amidohydrolase family protein [Salinigranum sp.]
MSDNTDVANMTTSGSDSGWATDEDVWVRPKPEVRVNIPDEIVDCDAHIVETTEDVAKYIEDEETKKYVESGYFDYPNFDGWDRGAGGRIKTRTNRGPETQELVMDDLSLDYVILSPTKNLHHGKIVDRDLACALAQGYNDYILTEWLDYSDRFKTGIFVPARDPEFGAREIERLADEDGFVCVYINPHAGPEKALGDERYDPIYEAAEKHDLTIALHGGATTWAQFPTNTNVFHKFIEVHSVSHPFQQMAQVTSILCRGVPVRFPDIKFVTMEAGISWLPYLSRLDTEFLRRPNEAPLLERRPTEYFEDHFWITSQPMEEFQGSLNLMEYAGGFDNLLFSSDWPHWDFDSPAVVRDHFPKEEWSKIYAENARNAFPRL